MRTLIATAAISRYFPARRCRLMIVYTFAFLILKSLQFSIK